MTERNERLLLTGQSLADELEAIDDLKERIDALLDSPAALPAADQPE